MTTWLALGLQTLSLLGAIAGIYAKISARLTAIETRLQLDDAHRPTTAAARETATRLLLVEHCQASQRQCPAMAEHRRWSEPSVVTDPGGGRR